MKSEIRNPGSERSPKSEGEAIGNVVARSATISDRLTSEFELRISFGSRISAFGFSP
jgi:hypothetical protein